MRFRTLFLLLVILLLAGFVALNQEEFTRISVLSLGFTSVRVSLGLVMLVLLGSALVLFLASTMYIQSKNVLEARTHSRELATQRELADKAEASRFTELRTYLEQQALAEQRREVAMGDTLTERFARHQQALMARIDASENTMAAHIGQLEDRLTRRPPNTLEGGHTSRSMPLA